jgi:hypothetical protein
MLVPNIHLSDGHRHAACHRLMTVQVDRWNAATTILAVKQSGRGRRLKDVEKYGSEWRKDGMGRNAMLGMGQTAMEWIGLPDVLLWLSRKSGGVGASVSGRDQLHETMMLRLRLCSFHSMHPFIIYLNELSIKATRLLSLYASSSSFWSRSHGHESN